MVEQDKKRKTSSIEAMNLDKQEENGGEQRRYGFVTDTLQQLGTTDMRTHVAFANLPTYDEDGMNMRPKWGLKLDGKAVERFERNYGKLSRGFMLDAKNPSSPSDEGRLANYATSQNMLRQAWSWDFEDLASFTENLSGDDFKVTLRNAGLVISTDSLEEFIELLFILDAKKNKTGSCANPHCVAPYFIKKRKTQKYCEAGPCVSYAQRQAALRWWNKEGRKRREKRRHIRKNKARGKRQ